MSPASRGAGQRPRTRLGHACCPPAAPACTAAETDTAPSISSVPCPHHRPADEPRMPIDPLGLYAAGIDASDYVTKVAPVVRRHVPAVGDLLDIGAGGGQLGGALRDPAAAWTAVEPAPVMQARLAALADGPVVHGCDWQDAALPARGFDTVLAANIPAPMSAPADFLARCRAWARRTIVWIVPAQHGPRGLCLAACLPPEWHGEDTTPGVDKVLAGLAPEDRPDVIEQVAWTFALPIDDLGAIATHLADRLGFSPEDPRRPALRDHLAAQLIHGPDGPRLEVEKVSAVLVWRLA
ncbi:hypothetical protein CCR97_17505 [Rhodoplanes elegans]|nr:hypothetical protein [Rhodoplanes elegans]